MEVKDILKLKSSNTCHLKGVNDHCSSHLNLLENAAKICMIFIESTLRYILNEKDS